MLTPRGVPFAPVTTVAPPVSTVVNVMTVPSGALTKPPPEPSSTLTVAVKVWFAPTRLVPLGVIWMLASTKVLTAGPLLGATPSVVIVNGVGVPSVPVQLALPVTWPAVGEVNVTVHWPAASVIGR